MSAVLQDLLQSSPIVDALNTPGLSTWKTFTQVFALFGIGMDFYNITMYYLYSRIYLTANPMMLEEKRKRPEHKAPVYKKGIINKWSQSLKEQQEFQRVMINLLVHFGMTAYSFISIFINIWVLFQTFKDDAEIFAKGTKFVSTVTNLVLAGGGLAVIFVGIPYVSNMAVGEFLSTATGTSILWYHAVILATCGFNIGGLTSYYIYADDLIWLVFLKENYFKKSTSII